MKKYLLLALLPGCASIDQNSVTLPLNLLNNRASMEFSAEGKSYVGVATLQRHVGIGTKITFKMPKGTILFQLDNCAKEIVKIRPENDTYTYHYRPSIFKEAEDSCIMQAQATTFKGEMLTAIIDWTDRRRLPAKIWCNERIGEKVVGVDTCQNRVGKLIWIEFFEPVVWATEGCNEPYQAKFHTKDKVFEILVDEGFCAYGFMNEKRERFRLSTYGYTTINEVNIEASKGK